jgi:hypothetical protein
MEPMLLPTLCFDEACDLAYETGELVWALRGTTLFVVEHEYENYRRTGYYMLSVRKDYCRVFFIARGKREEIRASLNGVHTVSTDQCIWCTPRVPSESFYPDDFRGGTSVSSILPEEALRQLYYPPVGAHVQTKKETKHFGVYIPARSTGKVVDVDKGNTIRVNLDELVDDLSGHNNCITWYTNQDHDALKWFYEECEVPDQEPWSYMWHTVGLSSETTKG